MQFNNHANSSNSACCCSHGTRVHHASTTASLQVPGSVPSLQVPGSAPSLHVPGSAPNLQVPGSAPSLQAPQTVSSSMDMADMSRTWTRRTWGRTYTWYTAPPRLRPCTLRLRFSQCTGIPVPGTFFLLLSKKLIWYEIQLIDGLVVGSFEPSDARVAYDGICRHFAYGSYLLKVW
jgi:hypothetical protein